MIIRKKPWRKKKRIGRDPTKGGGKRSRKCQGFGGKGKIPEKKKTLQKNRKSAKNARGWADPLKFK